MFDAARNPHIRAIALGFALVFAAASGALAADSSITATPPATSSESQPATAAPMPPESRIAAATALLNATNAMANVTQLIDSMLAAEAHEIKRKFPGSDEAKFAAVEKLMHDAFLNRQDEYKRLVAIVYAQHFSEEDLRALTAFYQTPVGKRYVETMPSMIKDMMPVGMVWGRASWAISSRRSSI